MAEAPTDARLYEKYAADPAVYAEVMSFAEYLGFDLASYPDLYWIAEQVTHAHSRQRGRERDSHPQAHTRPRAAATC